MDGFTSIRRSIEHMKITVQKVIKGVRYLKHYGVKEFFIRLQEKMESENVPYEPWYEHHKATEETLRRQRKQSAAWKGAPCVSIVVPLYCTNETFLREMIGSVQVQSYENWELCLADGSPEENAARLETVVRECAGEDARICYRRLEKNLGIAGNTNAAIAMAHGEWIALLDHDDLLAPDALYETVHLILRGPKDETGVAATGFRKAGAQYDMIYTDEDKVDMDGKTHFQPHFKPDINIDLLRSNNYITHFTMMRKTLLEKAGMIREEYDGAQDYDLFLRCVECAEAIGHVPRVLYHWRCHTESTSENPFSKQYAVDAGRRALEDHLKRQGIAGEVTATKDMGFYTVRYPYSGNPLVSIVIPSRDEVETLKKCLAAIQKTHYANYEVIVVENNSAPETFDFYRSITSEEVKEGEAVCYEGTLSGGQRICVAVWKEGFNYSALNNFGVSHAKGEYLVLMNNDIEMITEDLPAQGGRCRGSEAVLSG